MCVSVCVSVFLKPCSSHTFAVIQMLADGVRHSQCHHSICLRSPPGAVVQSTTAGYYRETRRASLGLNKLQLKFQWSEACGLTVKERISLLSFIYDGSQNKTWALCVADMLHFPFSLSE